MATNWNFKILFSRGVFRACPRPPCQVWCPWTHKRRRSSRTNKHTDISQILVRFLIPKRVIWQRGRLRKIEIRGMPWATERKNPYIDLWVLPSYNYVIHIMACTHNSHNITCTSALTPSGALSQWGCSTLSGDGSTDFSFLSRVNSPQRHCVKTKIPSHLLHCSLIDLQCFIPDKRTPQNVKKHRTKAWDFGRDPVCRSICK